MLRILSGLCSLKGSWSGSIFVPSCRCCMFVSWAHPVALLNDAFGIV